jgi:thiamine biosynthesis protein ThiI
MYNAVICRYHEIATKGNNRYLFENQLVENMRYLLRDVDGLKIAKVRGRIWVSRKDKQDFSDGELAVLRDRLGFAFGLESFSPVVLGAPDMEFLRTAVRNCAGAFFDEAFAKRERVAFAIRARRSDKSFGMTSKEIEIDIAEVVNEHFGRGDGLYVNLDRPEVTVFCEVRDEFAFVYFETLRGPGGLPVGSNPPVLALLSGGIDSPVACNMLMKRGCRVHFVTFHSDPYTPPESSEKVKRIADSLNRWQRPGRLFLCNLAEIQKAIRDICNPRYRTVLYRRMMFRIAEKLLERCGAKAIITGESVGQVASQTITNLSTINSAIQTLVLRPLIGMDKSEAIDIARRIDTFELSSWQVPDSCTVFAPDQPATSVPQDRAEREEELLGDYEAVLDRIVEECEMYVSGGGEQR